MNTCAPRSSGTQCETRDHVFWPVSQWWSWTDAHLSSPPADPANRPWRTPEKSHVIVFRFLSGNKLLLLIVIVILYIYALRSLFLPTWPSCKVFPRCFHNTIVQTLVCPNLYWLWSISREPNSFSAPFLLSMNCPSGMEAGFRMRYLQWPYLKWSTLQL